MLGSGNGALEAVKGSLTESMEAIAGDVGSTIAAILPFALAIVGIGLVITLGVKYFRKVSK